MALQSTDREHERHVHNRKYWTEIQLCVYWMMKKQLYQKFAHATDGACQISKAIVVGCGGGGVTTTALVIFKVTTTAAYLLRWTMFQADNHIFWVPIKLQTL